MWSVGISASESEYAAKLGYDKRQINRIVIRLSQYFLGQNMRLIFGHDWRADGVMQAVANFAQVVASQFDAIEDGDSNGDSSRLRDQAAARMINLTPVRREGLSKAAVAAERESGEVLNVVASNEVVQYVSERICSDIDVDLSCLDGDSNSEQDAVLTALRHCLTMLLEPGCRICLGGRMRGFQGREPGVIEEARLALAYKKPLYLIGGFGGATQEFVTDHQYDGASYWEAKNGLTSKEKRFLFATTDIERAIRLILRGINRCRRSNEG